MTLLDHYQQLLRYETWANERTIASLAGSLTAVEGEEEVAYYKRVRAHV